MQGFKYNNILRKWIVATLYRRAELFEHKLVLRGEKGELSSILYSVYGRALLPMEGSPCQWMGPSCLWMGPSCLWMSPSCLWLGPSCLWMGPYYRWMGPSCLWMGPFLNCVYAENVNRDVKPVLRDSPDIGPHLQTSPPSLPRNSKKYTIIL